MKCLKCGQEYDSEQVFCDDCLLEMKKYPVAPSTAVHLPVHRKTSPSRKVQNRRRSINYEEQVKTLKKRVWILTGALAVTLALLLATIYPAAGYFLKKYHLRPGQNYHTVISTDAPVASETEGD